MNKLKQALAGLDVENDAHWTKAGLPSIEALSAALGTAVTRKDVDAAQQGFSRENPVVEPDEAEEDEDDFLDTGEDPAQASSAVTQVDGAEATTSTDVQKAEDPREGDGVGALRRDLAEAESRVDAIVQGLAKGRELLKEAEADADAIRDQLMVVDPPLSQGEEIRRWLDSQAKARAERAGVPHQHVARSPIDSAMRSARGHGLKRPSFNPAAKA